MTLTTREQVKLLHAKGYTRAEMVSELNVSFSRTTQLHVKLGLKPHYEEKYELDDNQVNNIIALYQQTPYLSLASIKARLNISVYFITRVIFEKKLKRNVFKSTRCNIKQRRKEVQQMVSLGWKNRRIADVLHVSLFIVGNDKKNLGLTMRKPIV